MKRLICFLFTVVPCLVSAQGEVPLLYEMPDLKGIPIRKVKVENVFGETTVSKFDDSSRVIEAQSYSKEKGWHHRRTYTYTTQDSIRIIRETELRNNEKIRYFTREWRNHYNKEKKLVKSEEFIETSLHRLRCVVDSNFQYVNGNLYSFTNFTYSSNAPTRYFINIHSYTPDGKLANIISQDSENQISGTRTYVYNGRSQLVESAWIGVDTTCDNRTFYDKHDRKGLWREKYSIDKQGRKWITRRTISYR